jgi:hypothetical protein
VFANILQRKPRRGLDEVRLELPVVPRALCVRCMHSRSVQEDLDKHQGDRLAKLAWAAETPRSLLEGSILTEAQASALLSLAWIPQSPAAASTSTRVCGRSGAWRVPWSELKGVSEGFEQACRRAWERVERDGDHRAGLRGGGRGLRVSFTEASGRVRGDVRGL